MAVLVYLASRPGVAVPKEELLEAVWPNRIVGEDVLWRCVSELRRNLGDDARAQRVIQTLPRRGYRLAATISRSEPALGRRALRATAAGLGFSALLLVGWLIKQQPPEAPEDRPTATHEETEAERLYKLAFDYYWRPDRADLERSIELYRLSLAADAEFAPALAGLADAYCTRATHHEDHRGWVEVALTTARKAVEAGPEVPEAHKALARVFAAKGQLTDAVAANLRAIELRPGYSAAIFNLAAAYRSLGELDEAALWLARLESEPWERRIHLPGRGLTLALLGDRQAARRVYLEALEIQPLQPVAVARLARIDLLEGQTNAARRRVERALEVQPASTECLKAASEIEHITGRLEEALLFLDGAVETGGPSIQIRRASLLAQSGRVHEAESTLEQILAAVESGLDKGDEDWGLPYSAAAVHAIRGDREDSVEWLRRAVESGFRDSAWLRIDPIFEGLRGSAEFQHLVTDLANRVLTQAARVLRIKRESAGGERQIADTGQQPSRR